MTKKKTNKTKTKKLAVKSNPARRIRLTVNVNSLGVPTIDEDSVKSKTQQMIADWEGVPKDKVWRSHNLKSVWGFDAKEKRRLKRPIDQIYFAHYNADADVKDLAKATTVGDLGHRIYSKYIKKKHRG